MKKNYFNFKNLSLALSFAALFGAADVKAQVLVAATAGNTGPLSYPTLSQAFTALNNGTHQGVITISVTANITEPASPVALVSSGNGSALYTSVSIKPVGGNFTINSNATPSPSTSIIGLSGADNVTIDGDDPATAGLQNLSIVAAPVTTVGIACIRFASNSITGADGANNNTIRNCIIKGSRDVATSTVINYGIQFTDLAGGLSATSPTLGAYSSTNTIIQGNSITRCHYGIHAVGNSTLYPNIGTAIQSNTIGSATATDYVSFRGIDISYSGTNAVPSTAVIALNDIRTGQASPTTVLSAVEIADANSGIVVTRNSIHDCINGAATTTSGMYGISITSPANNNDILIRNNMIRDIKGGAVTTLGNVNGGIGVMVTASVTGVMLIHNTIAQLATGIVGSCVQINDAAATVSKAYNNIFVNNVATANNSCFYTTSTVNITSGAIDNNDYFINAAGILGYYNGANRANFNAWTAAIQTTPVNPVKDNNSQSFLPNFVSATNLHIVSAVTSSLESAGAPTAVTNTTLDIDGDVRPGPVGSIYGGGTAPDIGADEFDGLKGTCNGPTITAVASPTGIVCSGSAVTLTASATSGSPTFTWNTINNGTVTSTPGSSLLINPTVATTYTLVGTLFGCSSATVITINVDNTATLSVVRSATAICNGATVTFTASGATTYTFSNGITNATAYTPTTTATTATNITYTVSGTNACGTVSTTTSILVNPLPTLAVTVSSPTICSGVTTTLTAASNATTFLWAAGSATTSTLAVGPSANTSYTVRATSTDGCTVSVITTVTVVTTPVAIPVASSPSICSGGTATLTATGATNYTWNPGGFNTAAITVTPPLATVATTITYTVTKSNANCVDTQTLNLVVQPLPVLFGGVSQATVCAGTNAILTAGGANTYTFSSGPTTPNTTNTVNVAPTTNTAYTFTGSAGGCAATYTINVPVNPTPTVTLASGTSTLCSGTPAVLTAAGALTYTWVAGTTTLNGNPVTVTPNTSTSYVISGSNSFSCTASITHVIIVYSLPTITVAPPNYTMCLGKTATLTAGGAGVGGSYTWSPTGLLSPATITVAPTASTVYTVLGQNNLGCVNSQTAGVTVFNPAFTPPASTAICLGTTLNITATGANSYTWFPGPFTTANVAISPTVGTTYSITGASTVTNGSALITCPVTYTFHVTVNPNPTVTANATRSVICRDETTSLNGFGAVNYTWAPAGVGTGSTVVVPSNPNTASYINLTTYTVTGADANNCRRTATVTVATSGCVGIDEATNSVKSLLVFPNPNNGDFTIQSDENITLSVINQLGQVIQTLTLSEGNNHQVNISNIASGVYFVVGANQNGSVKQKIIINK